MSAPKGVLWDVGNVIVRWDPRALYSKIFPDPAERDRFLAEVCTMAWHGPTDCGRTFDEKRLAETRREVDDRRDVVVANVVLRLQALLNVADGIECCVG